MSEGYIVRRPEPVGFEALVSEQVSPWLAKLYAARGVKQSTELDARLAALPSPDGLKGMTAAVDRLVRAIDQQEKILIVADYDADGATACAVAIRGLRGLGAKHVDYLVPNRFEHGYGLTPEIVDLAAARKPQLLITVDNGIASIDGVARAKALGIDVLVTDHHLPADQLPEALIVNPNQPGCTFESKAIAGVGVMFFVLIALRARLRASGHSAAFNLATLLDLVATGTVADVVSLDRVNRIFVTQGIARMREGQLCAGLRALLQVARREPERLQSSDLGFALGPRINAAGRLTDMSLGIECLLTDDLGRALELAMELDSHNRERREIETGMRLEAESLLANLNPARRFSLALFDPSWHPGVVGIVASRIKDQTHRPTFAFAPGNNSELRGSGRSIAGFHLRDALDLVSKRHPQLLKKFGGHAMAAGVSIAADDLAAFESAFEETAQALLSPAQLERRYESDGSWPQAQYGYAEVNAIERATWGQSFPAPLFDDEFEVVQQKPIGNGQHLKLRLKRVGSADPEPISAVMFRRSELLPKRFQALYKPVVNDFQGLLQTELILEFVA